LPIPFWAEAVNTACYVQNRVLVTKPQHKTPYELLHGRSPSIGFMRPCGCLVTILNTLDSLGKFEGLENTPNVVSTGPIWLFDIDSLTRTMNYQPVTTSNQTNPNAGFKKNLMQEKQGRKLIKSICSFFNDVSAASLIVHAAGQNCSNSTNLISAARPLNSNSSSTHGNSSLRDASQSPDVLEMENIVSVKCCCSMKK
nr:retrovirus-related Pol polyprotein from transposon TNT 1-94 [Tanacetum cinerariifolium]